MTMKGVRKIATINGVYECAYSYVTVVARIDAVVYAILLPIREVEKVFSGLLVILIKNLASLFPLVSICFILILSKLIMPISEPAKNPYKQYRNNNDNYINNI